MTQDKRGVCVHLDLSSNELCFFFFSRDFRATLDLKGLLEVREEKVKWDLLDPKESL